jgi:hypothetical protein
MAQDGDLITVGWMDPINVTYRVDLSDFLLTGSRVPNI